MNLIIVSFYTFPLRTHTHTHLPKKVFAVFFYTYA